MLSISYICSPDFCRRVPLPLNFSSLFRRPLKLLCIMQKTSQSQFEMFFPLELCPNWGSLPSCKRADGLTLESCFSCQPPTRVGAPLSYCQSGRAATWGRIRREPVKGRLRYSIKIAQRLSYLAPPPPPSLKKLLKMSSSCFREQLDLRPVSYWLGAVASCHQLAEGSAIRILLRPI